MEILKRLFIFLLLAVGVFGTVEWISSRVDSRGRGAVSQTTLSSVDKPVPAAAGQKSSGIQAHQKAQKSSL